MRKYYTRVYFSLDDIANELEIPGKGIFRMAESPSHRALELPTFINRVLAKAEQDALPMNDLIANKYLTEVWTKYIYPKFWNLTICCADRQYNSYTTDEEEISAAAALSDSALGTIASWMFASTEKYSLLISNLEANKDKLLNQIKSTSVSRFNDTPQNEGDFSTDEYNSTVTKNEAVTDGGTVLARLNEIEDNMKRLYDDWSNEFRQFIMWSVND